MADQHHAPAIDFGQSADDRWVLTESPITGERQEIVSNPGEIILEMRPLRMPRDLRLLPRRQLRVGIAQQLVGLGFEPADLGVDVDRAVARGLPQLRQACFKLCDRLFEIEVSRHGRVRVG